MQKNTKSNDHPTALNPEDKKVFYALGYALYQGKQYAEAANFFALLSLYEPANSTYYAAIAACRKMLKEYDQAIYHYKLASLTEPEEVKQLEYLLKMTECQIAIGSNKAAVQALKQLFAVKIKPSPAINNIKKTARNWLNVLR